MGSIIGKVLALSVAVTASACNAHRPVVVAPGPVVAAPRPVVVAPRPVVVRPHRRVVVVR